MPAKQSMLIENFNMIWQLTGANNIFRMKQAIPHDIIYIIHKW